MPRFSIIIPIYNVEGGLEECLYSIKSQSFDDFEALCIIDGATDGSEAIARNFAADDHRFEIILKENGGVSSARNVGIERAKGDIILFVDGDDCLEPHCLERIAQEFTAGEPQALIFGASAWPENKSNDWYEEHLSPPQRRIEGFTTDFAFAPYTTPFIWMLAFSRPALLETGVRFDESLSLGEDAAFLLSLYPRLHSFSTIPDKLYRHRLEQLGSLMDRHSDDESRLRAHIKLVSIVLEEWDRLGLISQAPQELLDWTMAHLFRGVENLPSDYQAIHLSTANDLLDGYLAEFINIPARIQEGCLCRGDGKTYVLYHVESLLPFASLECKARVDGRDIPANCYPFSNHPTSQVQNWVLEIPSLDTSSLDLTFMPDGRLIDAATLKINLSKSPWKSRLNYRLKGSLCSQIRDYESSFIFERFQCRIIQRFEKADGTVWRCLTEWIGDPDSVPEFNALTLSGEPLPIECHFCELQKGDKGEALENRLFLSIATAPSVESFILIAQDPGRDPAIQNGFTVVDRSMAEVLKAKAIDLTLSAADQNDEYSFWLAHHRIQPGNLRHQCLCGDTDTVAFNIIVLGGASSLPSNVQRTLGSLRDQSYENWHTDLIGHELAASEETIPDDPRFSVHDTADANWKETLATCIATSSAPYVLILRSGDCLEPNTLFEFAHCIATNSEGDGEIGVLYCDEDAFVDEDRTGKAVFRSKLNVDLLYSYQWLGQCVLFRKDLLVESMANSCASSGSSLVYETALFAYGKGERFQYLPKLLFHSSETLAPYRVEQDETVMDESARILQNHFDRIGVEATVERGVKPCTLRTRYALPSPHPLVSILIPSKDHIDLLEPCLRSIVEKSTYDAYEILVLENNSQDSETFEFYERIRAEHPQIRIVPWKGEFNFSKIINFGAENAKGDYFLLMNNDTEVIEPSFMEMMLGFLQRPDAGIVGAKLLFKDGLVQHAGIGVGIWDAVINYNQNLPVNEGGYLLRAVVPGNFSAVTAACHMVSASLFKEVGGYDESMAVAFNDIDFCLKVLRTGRLNILVPSALLNHYEFSSRGREEADTAKQLRWKHEQGLFLNKWPSPAVEGDPYTSPNLMKNNTYFRLVP